MGFFSGETKSKQELSPWSKGLWDEALQMGREAYAAPRMDTTLLPQTHDFMSGLLSGESPWLQNYISQTAQQNLAPILSQAGNLSNSAIQELMARSQAEAVTGTLPMMAQYASMSPMIERAIAQQPYWRSDPFFQRVAQSPREMTQTQTASPSMFSNLMGLGMMGLGALGGPAGAGLGGLLGSAVQGGAQGLAGAGARHVLGGAGGVPTNAQFSGISMLPTDLGAYSSPGITFNPPTTTGNYGFTGMPQLRRY
jgi:hypothetical protein